MTVIGWLIYVCHKLLFTLSHTPWLMTIYKIISDNVIMVLLWAYCKEKLSQIRDNIFYIGQYEFNCHPITAIWIK
jgi:hypothetical protein